MDVECECGSGLCEGCARAMRAQVLAVRQLHRAVKLVPRGLDVCWSCTNSGRLMGASTLNHAGVAYPCATIRTLDRDRARAA